MPGKFVMRGSGKGFTGTCSPPTAKTIATSEHCETRRTAMAGIESVRKNAAGATFVDGDEQRPAKKTAASRTSKRSATAKM
jgi:hypothetical protein